MRERKSGFHKKGLDAKETGVAKGSRGAIPKWTCSMRHFAGSIRVLAGLASSFSRQLHFHFPGIRLLRCLSMQSASFDAKAITGQRAQETSGPTMRCA
jgi:hypothetical protein